MKFTMQRTFLSYVEKCVNIAFFCFFANTQSHAEDDNNYYSSVNRKIRLPLIDNTYFIPQGLGSDDNNLYIAYYWKNLENNTGNRKITNQWSRIVEVDLQSQRTTRVFRLCYSTDNGNLSHMGGIEHYVTPNGKKFIFAASSKSEIDLYSIPNYNYSGDIQMTNLKPVANFDTQVIMGCMSISKVGGDSILWGMSASGSAQKLYGYRINPTVPPTLKLKYKTAVALGSPFVSVNGLACVKSIGNTLTFCFGLKNGRKTEWRTLSILRSGESLIPKTNETNSYPAVNGVFVDEFPEGGQDFTISNNEIWSASESGATFYQNLGWKNYPYFYSSSRP